MILPRRRRRGLERPYESPVSRAPDMPDQIQSFSDFRRQMLRSKPIDPEGESMLGRLLSDPPLEDGPYPSWESPPDAKSDIAMQLQAFNEARRQILANKPIDPQGERALGRLLSDLPEADGS